MSVHRSGFVHIPAQWPASPLQTALEPPVLFWIIIQWVNHLWHQLILLRDLEHGSRVFMPATVVSCREDGKQLSTSESLEAIHNTLVRSQDVPTPVRFEEELDAIRSRLHDVSCVVRVSDKVWLNFPRHLENMKKEESFTDSSRLEQLEKTIFGLPTP